jgi:drug/metabolite transporter (DMT)-like permease
MVVNLLPTDFRKVAMIMHKILLLTVLAAVAFVTCDALSAHWGKNGSRVSLISFSVLSPMGYLLFGYLNRFQKLAVAGIVVNLVIAMGTVAVGLLLFHEQLTRRETLGVVLGFVSIYVISGGK